MIVYLCLDYEIRIDSEISQKHTEGEESMLLFDIEYKSNLIVSQHEFEIAIH